MINIHEYVKQFYNEFLINYKTISNETKIIFNKGLPKGHYNSESPKNDVLFPYNRNFFFVRDFETNESNEFLWANLYVKENTTIKFFNVVNNNPILNAFFSEKDGMRYDVPEITEFFKSFCSKYKYITSMSYISPKSHNDIRPDCKKINLMIYDGRRRNNVISNKILKIKIDNHEIIFKDKLSAFYYLTDKSISIENEEYKNIFLYLVQFEFESYLTYTEKITPFSSPGFWL